MGQHAIDALDRGAIEQGQLYEHLEGNLSDEEAVDCGIIDHQGQMDGEALRLAQELPISLGDVESELDRLVAMF